MTRFFFFIILITGIILRLIEFTFNEYNYPNGYDYSLYYEMAYSNYSGIGPQMEYIYDFLHLPETVTHYETYYEILFGLVTSFFLYLDNGSFKSALFISMFGGILSIPLIYYYSYLLYKDKETSLVSSFLIAINPLLIERSSILMKESFISFLYILFFIFTLKNLNNKENYFYLGIASGILSLFQYETLPIIILSFFFFLLSEKKIKEFFVYLLSISSIIIPYSILFYKLTGLIFSTKILFFSTPYNGAPFSGPREFNLYKFIKKLVPSYLYIYRSSLFSLHGLFIFITSYTLFRDLKNNRFLKFLTIFLCIYIYIHAVSVDLWTQDYIVIYTLFTPLCARFFSYYKNELNSTYLNVLTFSIIYFILWIIEINLRIIENIIFAPKYKLEILIPIIISLLTTYKLSKKENFYKIINKKTSMLSLSLIVFITFELNYYMPYKNLFDYKEQIDFTSIQTHASILKNNIKDNNAIVFTDLEVNYLHYFSGIKLIKDINKEDTNNIVLKKYKPDYAYTSNIDKFINFKYTLIRKYKDKSLIKFYW